MRISSFNMRMLITVFACSISLHSSAQTQVPLQVSVSTVSNSAGTIDVICYALLQDTSSISQIEVQLGNATDSSNIGSYAFNYDQTSGLPSGYTYQRIGNNLTLNIGSITDVLTLFGRARIKDTNGNWGDYFRFISN